MGLLGNRDFALLFAGQGVSRLGDGLYTAAVSWPAWTLARTPGAVAVVTVAATAPAFAVTLIGASAAEVFGALVISRLPLGDLALTAVLAWVILGAFRFPLGLATSPLLVATLLTVTGFASAMTDIPLVQQRIPDRHLAKALGIGEAGIAGAVAIAPVIAATVIDHAGVKAGFMLSGAALIVIGATAALILTRRRSRCSPAVPRPLAADADRRPVPRKSMEDR